MSAHKEASVLSYENRMSDDPNSMIFSRLADSYRKRGDIQQAIDVCLCGLTNHPDSTTGRIILARCYLEQEKLDEAVNEFVNVIEHDRRNQVAIKMLADAYARQGLKDKAGDLYAYLAFMDPFNSSVVNLTETFPGSGKTNIFEILGVSPQPPSIVIKQHSQTGETLIPGDDSAFTSTMPLGAEELAVDKETSVPEQFDKTIQYDTGELKQAEELLKEVEQDVVDVPKTSDMAITGDDVNERMTAMFDEAGVELENNKVVHEAAAEPEVPTVATESAMPSLPINDAPVFSGDMPQISGNDISSRIDQLFSNMPSEEVSGATDDYTQMLDSSISSENQEIEVIPVDIEEPADEPVRKEIPPRLDHEQPSDVSGEDIVYRMTEMFELPEEKKSVEEEMLAIPVFDESKIDDTAEIAIPDISKSETVNEENIEKNVLYDADNPSALPVLADIPEPAVMVQGETVSGDDIAERLENIFDENSDIVPSSSATPDTFIIEKDAMPSFGIDESSALNLPEEDNVEVKNETTSFDVKDDTSFEVEDEDSIDTTYKPEPVKNDVSLEDDNAQQEPAMMEDIGALQTKLIDIPLLNNATQPFQESISDTPDMSGNDVLSRLDELFPQSSLVNDASFIPEGEKDEKEEINEGFYSISGENAKPDGSEEPLLEKLDKTETENSANFTYGNENVLIEQDFSEPQQDSLLGKVAELQDPAIFSQPLDIEIETPDITTALSNQAAGEQSQSSIENEDQVKDYSIPDHVLTPTLADIYFQQGQPQLAVEIYERLLKRDPDNGRIVGRIDEIKKYISEIGWQPSDVKEKKPAKKAVAGKAISRSSRAAGKSKPLSGVRIKKGPAKKS